MRSLRSPSLQRGEYVTGLNSSGAGAQSLILHNLFLGQ